MIGTTLGHYRLETPLGSGGMGSVYLARALALGRMAAVKVVGDRFEPSLRQRLLRARRLPPGHRGRGAIRSHVPGLLPGRRPVRARTDRQAQDLFTRRDRYNFSLMWTCTDDVTLLELARAARALHRPDADSLMTRALDAGAVEARSLGLSH